jgi:hypothetical protein
MDVVIVLFLALRSTEYMISTYQLQTCDFPFQKKKTCDLMTMYFLFISACLPQFISTLYQLVILMGVLLHCC